MCSCTSPPLSGPDLRSLVEGQTISYELERDQRSGKESAVQLKAV